MLHVRRFTDQRDDHDERCHHSQSLGTYEFNVPAPRLRCGLSAAS
jgi:hypothetical protein